MKRFLLILLAIVMCLSLAACDNDNNDDAGESKADRMYKKYKEIIKLLEDEDYNGAYQLIAELSGEENTDPDDGNNWAEVYGEIIGYLNKDNYTSAIDAIIRLEHEKNKSEPTDLKAILFNDWYNTSFSDEEPVAQTAKFSENGKCVINGEEMDWILDYENETNLRLEIYKDGVQTYSANLEYYEQTDMSHLIIHRAEDGMGIGRFYLHPLFIYYNRHNWYPLDPTEGFVSFDWEIDRITMNDTKWNYVISSMESQDRLSLNVYSSDAKNPEYTFTLYFRDGYPVVDVLNNATGATCLYYNGNSDSYSKTWPEYQYKKAVESLESIRQGYSIYHEELQTSVRGNEALAYIYDMLTRCGNYKDSADYLAKFTILENMLSQINTNYVDNLGYSSTSQYAQYQYDSNGRIIYTASIKASWFLFGYSSSSYADGLNYVYNEQGTLIEIYKGSENSKSQICTPFFDENGNLTALECRTNSGTWTNTFEYDSEGKLVCAKYYSASQTDIPVYTHTFTYDDIGRLIRETVNDDEPEDYYWSFVYTIDYTYDENGYIATEFGAIDYTSGYVESSEYTILYTYTVDDNGNILCYTVEDSTNTNYASISREYIYQDLYYYAFN